MRPTTRILDLGDRLPGLHIRCLLIGFPAIFLIVGLLVAMWAVRDWREARASLDWATTPGTVTDSSLEETTRTDRRHTITSYSPRIRYSYRVGGREFHGSRVSITASSSSDKAAQAGVVARYPVGAEVHVHYDPEAPARSCLEPGESGALFLGLFAALFTAFGGTFTTLAWRLVGPGATPRVA